MTSGLLLALLAQLALVGAGLALLQLLTRSQRIPLLGSLPFAWGTGVMVLYCVGAIAVRMDVLRGSWHFALLALFALLGAWAWRVRARLPREPETVEAADAAGSAESPGSSARWRWYEWLLLALILLRGSSVLAGVLLDPVIDSDAANLTRWVGLAKAMVGAGGLPEEMAYRDRFFPSLLSAWTAMFLPRWHDSLVSLPWFFTFAALVGVAFVGCYRLTGRRDAALLSSYLFASIPLSALHVIRPGYSDLIACYFFLSANVFLLAAISRPSFRSSELYLLLLSTAACAMTKQEGAIWAVWCWVVVVSFHLHRRRNAPWGRILAIEACAVLVLYLAYLASADLIRSHVELDPRVAWLFEIEFDWAAVRAFGVSAFLSGSFNLWWWIFGLLGAFVAVGSQRADSRVMLLYVASLFLGVFYFACFTGNVGLTVAGTNLARFLLQVTPLILPLWVVFANELLPAER